MSAKEKPEEALGMPTAAAVAPGIGQQTPGLPHAVPLQDWSWPPERSL